MLITSEQIRAARALLCMDQDELARRANVSVVTVRRIETPGGAKVASSTVDEAEARALLQCIALAEERVMSAVSFQETSMVLAARRQQIEV
jgi:predicted transcriptional regulator